VQELKPYVNLTTVILNDNKLQSLRALRKMRNLKVLNAQGNLIETLDDVPLEKFKWLQVLITHSIPKPALVVIPLLMQ